MPIIRIEKWCEKKKKNHMAKWRDRDEKKKMQIGNASGENPWRISLHQWFAALFFLLLLHVYTFLGVPLRDLPLLLFFFLLSHWNEIRLQFMIYLLWAMCYVIIQVALQSQKSRLFCVVVVLVSSISRSQVINWKLYGKTDWRHTTRRREVVHTHTRKK